MGAVVGGGCASIGNELGGSSSLLGICMWGLLLASRWMVEEGLVFWCSNIAVGTAKSMEGGVGMVRTVCRAGVPHKASKWIRVLLKSILRD